MRRPLSGFARHTCGRRLLPPSLRARAACRCRSSASAADGIVRLPHLTLARGMMLMSSQPARRTSKMIRVAFIIGDYPPEQRKLREDTAKSFSTAEVEVGI